MSNEHPQQQTGLLSKQCRALFSGIAFLFKGTRFNRFTALLSTAFLSATLCFSPAALALSIDEAVAKVQSERGGKVLDVQKVTVHNAPAYRIKLLQPEGRVEVLLIDSNSGKPLSDKKD